jgi:predicted Zn-dependent protease
VRDDPAPAVFFVQLPSPILAGMLTTCLLAVTPEAARAQTAELAAHAQQGKQAMASGHFDEAVAHYAAIVQALPNEAGMRLNLGMALSMAGRPREAVPQLRAALKLQPGLLPASLFLGAAHMELGEPAQAVPLLETFVAAQPGHRDARQMLADALLSLARCEPAARQYQILSEQGPQDPKAWYGFGRSYERLAQDAFETLETSAPESPLLLFLIAQALLAQERDKRALPLYKEATSKEPGLVEAHEGMAQIYERSGHADWAAVERGRAREVPPPDCRSASLECAFREGRYHAVLDAARPLATTESRYWTARAAGELAREAFTHLAQLPPSAEATLVRVEVLRGQRRYLESKQELEKAVSAWPEDRRLRRELATLHFIAREYAEARPLLEELLKREPHSVELNLLLGEAWLESKQPARGLPYLEAAVRDDPKLVRGRAVLGRAYLDAGEAERAIPHLEAALPTDEDGSLHFQLARAYRTTGRAEQATRALATSQELRQADAARLESEKEELAITPP